MAKAKAKEERKGILEIIEDRYFCSVLESIRDCSKTSNFSQLPSLVEELQLYGDRMEDGLSRTRDAASTVFNRLEKIEKIINEEDLTDGKNTDKLREHITKANEALNKRWRFRGNRYGEE